MGTDYDPQQLRIWLLYWDKIFEAGASNIRVGRAVDFDFLERNGSYAFREMSHPGGELSQIFLESRARLFDELEAVSPGSWAIASSSGAWDGEEGDGRRALRVQLMKALPVPDQAVPLEEIISFREKRRSERDALMASIDDVYQSVVGAPDRPLAEHTALAKLAVEARSQLDVMAESKFSYRLCDMAADFNLGAAALCAVGTLALGTAWPAVVGNSLLAGATITIGKIAGLINSKKADTPYRYVASYHSELFRPE
ncbi:hypothetical protein FF80_03464 [Devosia sp. LC5]|uniref:DUF6236 family protein n=1 Tax=Devosia sp. LC5 TaxID=1502724 RepID=UPI0004E388C0|nr:DUF6236 family protein [Devosia sp. LC5]KFC62893.1 hypothetical protein FF80_03464 [Devosia sp. LC5]